MRFTIFSGLIIVFCISSCSTREEKTLTIACSSNTQFVMEELKGVFEKSHALQVKTVYASSGKLSAQIINGAPFDLFFSADMKYPQTLFNKGISSKPKPYAKGSLVLWSQSFSIQERTIGEFLKSNEIEKVAIPNPKTAPYGKAALEALKNMGLYEKLKDRLVYSEGISQTNHYIASKAVDAGITSQSAVLAMSIKKNMHWKPIPESYYSPIQQGLVIIKREDEELSEKTEEFYDFIFSEKAAEIFKKHGYLQLKNE